MESLVDQLVAAITGAVQLRGPNTNTAPPDDVASSCTVRDLVTTSDPAYLTPPAVSITSFDVVLYTLLRQFLSRQSAEALAALLEDCVIYTQITAPASRLKW